MLKKISLGLVALASVVGLTLVAAPAHANFKQATCSTNNVSGDLTVVTLAGDPTRLDVTGGINDGQGRTWSWQMYHNGDLSASGTRTGTGNINRTMINFNGTDTVRFKFQNVNGPASCEAVIQFTG